MKIVNANVRLNDSTYFPGEEINYVNKPIVPYNTLLKYMTEQKHKRRSIY